MPSWPAPSEADVTAALARLGQPQQRAYFFDRLDNPLWVAPLRKAHAFSTPPDPIAVDDQVSFPPWPEGEYLTRMAAEVPDDVTAILKQLEGNDNPLAARVLLQAAVALPDTHLPDVLPTAPGWFRTPYADWYVEPAVTLITRTFELGHEKAALKLARSLLAVQPDPRMEEKRENSEGDVFRPSLEPSSRLTDWEYQRGLSQLIPGAARLAGGGLARLLSSLLTDALRHSKWEDEERDSSEYSMIWRPAIEDHTQNHDRDVRDTLISGLRDVAFTVIDNEPGMHDEIVELLMRGSKLHQRIGLHILSKTTGGLNTVTERLRDPEFLNDYRFTHEIAQVLDGRWNDLDETTQHAVLAWIEEGDVARHRQLVEESDGTPPADEALQQHKAIWQRDKYSFIARHLTGTHLERYNAVRGEFGEPSHADFETWMDSWSGTTGPVEQTDLEGWPIGELVTYLRTWEPTGMRTWPPGPTIEGLANTLQIVATERAAEFARHAAEFVDVDPTYIRALFDAFESAQKNEVELDWGPILTLARSVADREFEPDVQEPDRDRDPGYRWVRRHVSSAIQAGLRDQPNAIGWEHREQVWVVIERLTGDPNPTPEHEKQYGGDNMDPLMLSLNTNRPTALNTVVEYGLWCRRHLIAAGTTEPTAGDHFGEILRVLDRHLDVRTDPSLATRAVYGRWYAWLLLLDEPWATGRAEAVFGPVDTADEHGQAGWDTYIVRTAPYDSSYRVLRRWYERAVKALPDEDPERIDPVRSPWQKLGEHLTSFAWRGHDDTGLAEQYFDRATDGLAGSVTSFIGRTLSNTTELPTTIGARIQAHWEHRIGSIRANPDEHQAELRAFSTWFTSNKLDPQWSLGYFEEAVALAGAPRHAKSALERLAEEDIDPVVAVQLLAVIVERATDPWEHMIWREPAKAILARASGLPGTRDATRSVIDYFVRTGDQSFREFAPADDAEA